MILLLLNLAAAVALLLWSVRLVRTGIERGFSGALRTGVRRASERSTTAAASGVVAALMMQSSTAVAMLVAGFVAASTLPTVSGLIVILGADLGSSLVARILVSPISAITPVLFILGAGLFLKGRSRRIKQAGRVAMGIALVLTSLTMIRVATAPLQDSPVVGLIITYLSEDLISAFVIGAVLAWAMHSSVATVLMVVTLAGEGLLQAPVAAALVLGANLGGAAIPVLLTTSAAHAARQVMFGNLLLRGGGSVFALLALMIWTDAVGFLGGTAAAQAINLHVLFNAVLLLLCVPLTGMALTAVSLAFPEATTAKPRRISALDESAMNDPERALACAAREVLVMGEQVHAMLAPALGLFRNWDDDVLDQMREREDEIDRMHFEVKLYIARLQEGLLTEEQARRAMDIATIANNLEDAGDQIWVNLSEMARRMHKDGLSFSDAGWRELSDFHDQVLSNVQLGLNVLMTGDADSAVQLVEEKDRAREAEQRLQAHHLDRLRHGNTASIETSNQHQETIRALKHINTAFAYVAYPIAEETGAMLSSRLAGSASRGS